MIGAFIGVVVHVTRHARLPDVSVGSSVGPRLTCACACLPWLGVPVSSAPAIVFGD